MRSDGKCVFYPSRTNVVLGDSESSKTFLTLLPAREALLEGERVFFFDWEDDVYGITARMVALGIPEDVLEARFHYINPEGPPDFRAFADTFGPFSPREVGIFDAVTAAFADSSVNGNADVEVTGWLNAFPKPLSKLGPCVILIDHVGKDATKGARGSSAKRDAVSGVQLTAVKRALLSPGHRGVTSLEVTKDRLGAVRAESLGGTHFGDAIFDATNPDGIVASIEPPLPNAAGVAAERVARAVASLDPSPDAPASTKDIQQALGAPFLTVRRVQETLADLHASGQLGRRMVGRTSYWWLG